jgi:hypothetical protein
MVMGRSISADAHAHSTYEKYVEQSVLEWHNVAIRKAD